MVGFFQGTRKPGREAQVLGAARQLWKDCVDLATLKQLGKVPFQDLLKKTGLGGWPYNQEDALPDVWEVAGKLQRLMELAPLVEVNVRIDNTLRLSPGYWNFTADSEDVLGAMMTVRTDSLRLFQLAEDVAAFSYRMNAMLYSHEPLISHHQVSDADLVLRPFLQVALGGLIPDVGVVATELENFIDPLVQLVRETRPETVLNFLGYRLLRHVDLFTLPVVKSDLKSAQHSTRRTRCTQVVLEDALPAELAEYVRYSALKTQLDFGAILSVEKDLKRVISAKLDGLPWMDNQTRKRAQKRLRDLKVRLSMDRYEGRDETAAVQLPEALPYQALATYQRFREARFRSRMLRVVAVETNATDPDCTHDAEDNVLYLRPYSAVETRAPRSPLWPMLQGARLAPMLARCILRAVLVPSPPERGDGHSRGGRWSAMTSVRFNEFLTCLRAQHVRGTSTSIGRVRGTLTAIQNAAMVPAKKAYDVYVVRLARITPLEHLLGSSDALTPLGWKQVKQAMIQSSRALQLFYAAYARSMCQRPNRPGQKEPHIPPRDLVNGPLSNDPDFHRAFHCLKGEPMRPQPTCRFWDGPPR
ncbi:neprilysin-4-like [Haemaphysalis longicornis]